MRACVVEDGLVMVEVPRIVRGMVGHRLDLQRPWRFRREA